MAYHYTVSYEREVGAGMVVSVAYVGAQGRHLLRQTTPNLGDNAALILPGLLVNDDRPRFGGFVAQPVQRDAGGNLVSRPSPFAGTVRIYEASANSRYDSLQLQVSGRLVRKTSYQFNYTLSKATDDVSDVFDLAGAPSLPQNSLTRAGERGAANFDARHIFSGYAVYDLPALRRGGWLKRFFMGNWQATGKIRFQTGQPFTVNTLFDINGDGNLTDRPDSASGLVVTGDRQQPLRLADDPGNLVAPDLQDGSVGRNTFRASGPFEFDLSILKRFAFEEGARSLTLRLDIFNVGNRANFGIPVRHLESPGFGSAVNTVTPARRLQFALKYSF